MRFADFTPYERQTLLHALQDGERVLATRLSVPIEPGVWQHAHELAQKNLGEERNQLLSLVGELETLVRVGLNN